MRVLHIGKYFPPFYGGIENFMADLIPAQLKQGIEVAVLVHHHVFAARAESKQLCIDGYSATVYRVPTYGRFLYAPFSPSFAFSLARLIEEFKPDVLHLHVPNTSVFWVLFSVQARRIPWVVHWHADVICASSLALRAAYYIYRPLETKLLAQCKAIITTSKAYLESSMPVSAWRHKCRVIPLGLAPSDIIKPVASSKDNNAIQWDDDDGFKILSLGRLSYYKGHDILLEAIKLLDDVKLIVVGEGEKFAFLQQLIDKNLLHDRVQILGGQPASVVMQLISGCDCVCLASIERTEAFGMVILEAMAHEKAVVATDIPGSGVGWVVKNDVTGKLVEPGNVQGLAEAFRFMAENKELCKQMGIQGKKRFKHKFHIQTVASQISALYHQVIKDE